MKIKLEMNNRINSVVESNNIVATLTQMVNDLLERGFYPEENILSVVKKADSQKIRYYINRGLDKFYFNKGTSQVWLEIQ